MDPSLTGSRTPITPRLTRREFLSATAAGLGALAIGPGCATRTGSALRSGQRCFWKVRVWDGRGRYEFSVDPLPRVLSGHGLPAAGSR